MTRYEDTLEHKIRCLPIFGTNKLLLTDVIDTVREHNQAATAAADAKYLPVIENQKETIRCMSVVFDDIAAQLNLPKEQYGDPDALMDAIEELKDKATLAATVVKGGE